MNIRNKLMLTCFFQALLPVFLWAFFSLLEGCFGFLFFSFQLLPDRIRKVIRFILE